MSGAVLELEARVRRALLLEERESFDQGVKRLCKTTGNARVLRACVLIRFAPPEKRAERLRIALAILTGPGARS